MNKASKRALARQVNKIAHIMIVLIFVVRGTKNQDWIDAVMDKVSVIMDKAVSLDTIVKIEFGMSIEEIEKVLGIGTKKDVNHNFIVKLPEDATKADILAEVGKQLDKGGKSAKELLESCKCKPKVEVFKANSLEEAISHIQQEIESSKDGKSN